MADTIRTVKSSGYRMMSTVHLTDKRLSWTAKGVMSALLALSGEYSKDELTELTHQGFTIGKGMKELEQYGYLVRKQTGLDEKGFPVMEYIVYERPLAKEAHPYSDSQLEIPYAEDVAKKTLSSECSKEEEIERLRERLNLRAVAEKCSENFVDMVFRELCRRDAEFCQMMTAEAFELVCLTASERQRREPICGRQGLIELINKYLDNVVLGIRSAGGGNELIDRLGVRERLVNK